jgi:oligogalacturonide lyase
MLPDERSFCHFDGPVLRQTNLANLRGREIYRVPDGWTRGEGATVSGDGVHAVFVERSGERYRLRLVGVAKGDALSVLEANEPIRHPVPRPRRAGILYRRGDSLWLVNYDGQQDRPLRLSPGRTGPARWSADGRTIVYLSFSGDERNLSSLREHTPDTHADQLIANTSQFIQFACNGDSSVFVGASSSKAFPYVLILLRVTARELTICEHRASDPAQVAPIFSPDSQQVFFQSDKEGRMAIYAMNIARLVERIES